MEALNLGIPCNLYRELMSSGGYWTRLSNGTGVGLEIEGLALLILSEQGPYRVLLENPIISEDRVAGLESHSSPHFFGANRLGQLDDKLTLVNCNIYKQQKIGEVGADYKINEI